VLTAFIINYRASDKTAKGLRDFLWKAKKPADIKLYDFKTQLYQLNKYLPLLPGPHVTEITQPCVHTCDGLFICQLYLLPELLEEMDSNEDTPLMLPFASFISLSQLIIVIWIKTSVGTTTVFHTGISRAVAVA
jgi:hypothetical protein